MDGVGRAKFIVTMKCSAKLFFEKYKQQKSKSNKIKIKSSKMT